MKSRNTSPKYDSQRERVYEAERGFCRHELHWHRVTLGCSQAWADWATDRWNVHGTEVRYVRIKEGRHIGEYGDDIIRLHKGRGNIIPVILHEVAHHITEARYGDKAQPHGPQFVGVLRDLLHAGEVLDKAAWDALCYENGVKRARVRP